MSSEIIGFLCVAGMFGFIALRMPIALAMAMAGFIGFGLIVAFGPAVSILENGRFRYAVVLFLQPHSDVHPDGGVRLQGAHVGRAVSTAPRRCSAPGAAVWRWRRCRPAGCFPPFPVPRWRPQPPCPRVALPEMKKNGYAASLATGTLAAGGTLGIMIPPSLALLLYGLMTEQSVGDMFIAGIIPGLLGLFLYMVAIAVTVALKPDLATPGEATNLREKLAGLKGLVPFGAIFALIIGGIYGGHLHPDRSRFGGRAPAR